MDSRIRNKKEVAKPIDFAGLYKSDDSPLGLTDGDAMLELDDKVFAMFEFKSKGAPLTVGQRLLGERIVRRWGKGGYFAKVEHKTDKEQKYISGYDSKVTEVYTMVNSGEFKWVNVESLSMRGFLKYITEKAKEEQGLPERYVFE